MNSKRIVFLSPLCLIIRYSLTVWQSIQDRSPKDKKTASFFVQWAYSYLATKPWWNGFDTVLFIWSTSIIRCHYPTVGYEAPEAPAPPTAKIFRRYAAWNLRMHRLLRVPSSGWSRLLSWQFSHFVPVSLFSYFDQVSSRILYWQYKKKIYLLLKHGFLLKNRI